MNWVKALGVSLFALFAPVHAVMATALALIIIDCGTGVVAARKRGEPITSAGLRRTVTKLFVYECGIVVSFLAEHFLLSDSLPLIKLAGGAIALVELKSTVENLNMINGSPVFASIIGALGSKNDQEPPK